MSRRVFALLLAIAAAAYWETAGPPQPTPAPQPPGGFVLRGLFSGPQAVADALAIGGLSEELACVIEWDGMLPAPRMTTGAAFDDLRVHAREYRMRGDSIGARQTRARDAIAAYMTDRLGTSGGPVSPESRAAWVSTLREIGRAATDAGQ